MEEGLEFENQRTWKQWLTKNHKTSPGVWLALGKKGCSVERVSHSEALDVALCYGWIDAKRMSLNDQFFLQRFVPRSKKSIWSKINREHIQRLMDAGEMHSAGLAEVDRAKSDGRWEAAYEPASRATVPEDLQAALDENPKAKAFFATLNGQNRYAILFRLHQAAKPELRKRKIVEFVEMLAEGRKFY